jgi:signal transduction histidine kinase
MAFPNNTNFLRWTVIVASFIIIPLILWNTYVFFQNFKAEERSKMEIWSTAHKQINQSGNLTSDIGPLPLEIISRNTTTPMILTDTNGNVINQNNISEEVAKDTAKLRQLIEQFKNENTPIEVTYENEVQSIIYYGNSPLLNKLKYYPFALVLIIILFGAVAYFFYRSSKAATQNKLWSGMAKETAHQIGTPLSSLIGWTEILKGENTDPKYIKEIEKDVERLQTIADRFGKIGSIPTLESANIVLETQNAYTYLKTRSSKLVDFEFTADDADIKVNLNPQLYSWTIENLVKNAIDAPIREKGSQKNISTGSLSRAIQVKKGVGDWAYHWPSVL